MKHFETRDGALYAEGVALERIAADYGTPTFVYSRAALTEAHAAYAEALSGRDAMLCYAVKSNSNLAIMNVFARLGTGFDIVSGGELARVIAAGGDPGKVVFSGVGKTRDEMRAALTHGIYCFNVESEAELHRLAEVAGSLGKRAPIALRVNPDVDPKTHPYISTGLKCNKFGVPIADAHRIYLDAAKLPQLEIRGIACHIGSQLLDPTPVAEAAAKVVALAEALNRDGIE
ncbi:MAG: alanine racemase, partial [Methyloversatilis sp.]|nr:alanine racemase [Methyloversatilis sp.]